MLDVIRTSRLPNARGPRDHPERRSSQWFRGSIWPFPPSFAHQLTPHFQSLLLCPLHTRPGKASPETSQSPVIRTTSAAMAHCLSPEGKDHVSVVYWEYILTGFDDFFEQRRVCFSEQLPQSRICATCCMVPAVSRMLPCGHILCEFCKDQAGEEGCPFDGKKFTNDDAVAFTVTLSDLELLQVVCIARDRQMCSFIGKISELRAHLVECGRGYVQCSSCGETLYRKATAEHYRECRKRRVAAFQSAFGVQRPRSPEDVLDTGDKVRKAAPKDSHSGGRSGAAGNCENDPSDGPASVESGSSAETQAVDVGDSRGKYTTQAPRDTSNCGPFRAATRPGVFTCTCVFLGVYAGYHSARHNNEHTIETEHYVLAGYTFKLYCKFSRDEVDKARVRFGMALCQGAWDSSVQWPFSRTVTLILTHVHDMTKDMRLPMAVHDIERVVRRPRPFVPNGVLWSKSGMWRDLELLGYVDDDNVYVTVEME